MDQWLQAETLKNGNETNSGIQQFLQEPESYNPPPLSASSGSGVHDTQHVT
jgi:hypothetical protein